MAMSPKLADVKWYTPSAQDPDPELQLLFYGHGTRSDLRDCFREFVPLLLKAKNPWKVLNLDNGANIILLSRWTTVGKDLTNPSDDTIESLHQASIHDPF